MYKNSFSSLYDIFYESKDYQKESQFLVNILNQRYYKPKALELAGGTGSHAYFISEICSQYCLTDISDAMLQTAKAKLKNKTNIQIEKMDMAEFKKFDKKFEAILCLFDSIGYLIDNEKINRVFQGVNDHLDDEGIFIFEYWNAGAFLRFFEPLRIKRFYHGNSSITRISETEIEYAISVAKVKYTVIVENNKKTVVFSEEHMNRFFLQTEIQELLHNNGFEVLNYYSGYTHDSKISIDTWHSLCIAKKK